MMLYRLPVLSPNPDPFCFFARPNKEKFPFLHRCVSLCTPDVLDFFTEVTIIHGWTNWIPIQSIDIRMSEIWSVDYFETEVLQHVHPPASPAMRIGHGG
jgi:hypothetical protein